MSDDQAVDTLDLTQAKKYIANLKHFSWDNVDRNIAPVDMALTFEALVTALKAANTDRDLAYAELIERGITIDSLRDDLVRVEAEKQQLLSMHYNDENERLQDRIADLEIERDDWIRKQNHAVIELAKHTEQWHDMPEALQARITELEGSLREAAEHVEELEDAWQRGVIHESDGERTTLALQGAEGKRLTLREPRDTRV